MTATARGHALIPNVGGIYLSHAVPPRVNCSLTAKQVRPPPSSPSFPSSWQRWEFGIDLSTIVVIVIDFFPPLALARPGPAWCSGQTFPPSLGGSLAGLRSEFREPEALQDVDRRRNRYLGRQGAAPQSRPFSWPVCALRRGRSKSGGRTDGREPHFIVLIGRKTRRLRGSRRRPGRAAAARWPVA